MQANAYPDFIGYKYSSCITCHYNGQGGGALNDYGRALFATEITARSIYSKKTEEDTIASESGFLGSKELPWWIRPGMKYRGLWLQNNPGSKQSSEKFYNMQTEAGVTIHFDEEQKLILHWLQGYSTMPRPFATNPEEKKPFWYNKEYYLRWQANESLWLYLGQMDKAFGIRHPDHTSVTRYNLGLGQFDQSQGVIAHVIYPTWEVAANAFVGNQDEEADFKQKGFSTTGEYEVTEGFRIGASVLDSKSEQAQWQRLALHTRKALTKGSSVLFEAGEYKNKNLQIANAKFSQSGYFFLQNLMRITRGYNILSGIEYRKQDLETDSTERLKWSVGTLFFPLPRTEMRFAFVNGKTYNPDAATVDSWQLQSQLHVSW